MPDNRGLYASEQEVADLREEIRRLRDERDRQKPQEPKPAEHKEAKDEQQKKPHPLRKVIIVAIVLLLLVGGGLWWLHSRHFEGTDDATVDAHTSGIAARVAGTIVGVYVEENQFVKSGEVVVDLDPRDYKAALAQAQGQLRQALGQAAAEQPNIPVTQVTNATTIATSSSAVTGAQAGVAAAERNYQAALAKVTEAEATNAKAQADVARYRPLAEKQEISREQFDQVVANARALAATVEANRAGALAAQRQVDQAREQLRQAGERAREAEQNAPHEIAIRRASVSSRQGSIEMARAQVEQAKLNLAYCKIVTPVSGVVSKRIAEVGTRVSPGEQLILVSQLDDLWVTANFRETQIRRMQAGQSVRIHVDALATTFDGYVESMPAASGAVTSLLPPENATGNFVKVVQRLPVRIRFKKGQAGLDRLRPGMSVEPKVRVR